MAFIRWASISEAARYEGDAHAAARSSTFRADIQGLRALAVLAVLFFHIWPHAIPGGFVGVDVFFVISGYLITGLLLRELESTGRIRLLDFYARRARRLLPAATLVLIAVALAMPLLPPARWSDTAMGIVAAALYVENWHLASLAVDYLASEDAPSPVQHYWSLSIEEQFYLVWPLVMIGVAWMFRGSGSLRRRLFAVLAAITLTSLGLSIWLTGTDGEAAYFATHTRVWELCLGGLLAVAALPQPSRRLGEIMRACGLAMIGVSIFAFSGATAFPGYAALLPTLGCALLLWPRTAAGPWTFHGLLASRPAQYLGDISYSLYLWHWPLIVIAGIYDTGDIGLPLGLTLLTLSLTLAALTTRFVEEPIRHWQPEAWRVLGLAAASIGFCVIFATIGYRQIGMQVITAYDGSPDYPGAKAFLDGAPVPDVESPIPPLSLLKKDRSVVYRDDCHLSAEDTGLNPCVFGARNGPRVMLIGDSHAATWVPALAMLAEQKGWRLESHTKSFCPLLLAPVIRREAPYVECQQWGQALLESMRQSPPLLVITTQYRIHRMAEGGSQAAEQRTGHAVADLWRELRGRGISVIGIADVPKLDIRPDQCIQQDAACAADQGKVQGQGDPMTVAKRLMPEVPVVDMSDALCREGKCPMIIGNIVAWRDSHHLTASFVRSMAGRFNQRILAAMEQADKP